MPNRYVSLVLEMPESDAESLTKLFDAAMKLEDADRPVGQVLSLPTHRLAGTWVTDYKPLDPTAETRHLLQLRQDTWVLEHPAACRAMRPLDECPVFHACEQSAGLADGAVLGRLGLGWYAVSTNKTGGLHFNLEKVDR